MAKILSIWFGMICVIVAIAMHVADSTILAPDFVKAADNIPSVMSKVLVVFKTWTSLRHRGDIWKLIQKMREIFVIRKIQNAMFGTKVYLDGYQRIMKFNSGIFAVVTLPVLIMFFRFLVDGTMSAVVVNYWYPFDAFKPQNFIFALTWLELIAYLSLVHSSAVLIHCCMV